MTSLNSSLSMQAKGFVKKGENIFQKEFEKILSLSLHSHSEMMVNDNVTNDINEETLSNKLCNRMEKEKGTFNLGQYYFVRESAEIDETTDITRGYTDIKAIIPNSSPQSSGTTSFTIECKIVDGYATKNRLYIEEGINRFTDGKYCCKTGLGGMIGFVRLNRASFNIKDIVCDINNRLTNDFRKPLSELLTTFNFANNNNAFKSRHPVKNIYKNVVLIHLMLDVYTTAT